MAGLHSNYITEPDTFRRVEVISGVARRRRWPKSEKARIVAESYAPGASATAVAVGHGLHRNQIFAWRRQPRNRAALIGNAVPGHCHGSGVSATARPACRSTRNRRSPPSEEARVKLLGEKQPSLEFTTPEQIGALATFLCSDAAAPLNGVALPVDGGWTAR